MVFRIDIGNEYETFSTILFEKEEEVSEEVLARDAKEAAKEGKAFPSPLLGFVTRMEARGYREVRDRRARISL